MSSWNLLRSIRRYSTSAGGPGATLKDAQKVTFLRPNINPHAPYTPQPSMNRLWTIAERRALFLYTRAISVHRLTLPSWDHVGRCLDRSASECKFTYDFILTNWKHHLNLKPLALKTTDAGITAHQLLTKTWKTDSETDSWLRKLTAEPEQVLVEEKPDQWATSVYREWSEKEMAELRDMCPLYCAPNEKNMREFTVKYRRSPSAVKQRYYVMMGGVTTKLDVKPLTDEEKAGIEEVARRVTPEILRYGHVKHVFGDRSFRDVLYLTCRGRRTKK